MFIFESQLFPYIALVFLLVLLVFAFLLIKKYFLVKKVYFDLNEPYIPEQKKINIPDFEINYVDEGSGPTLLLLHGIGASLYIWRFLYKPLSQNYRVIALDLPGFGKSSKIVNQDYGLEAQCERVLLFLKKLNVSNTYIVGSSMGGAISLWLSLKHPNVFKKNMVISPATNKKLLKLNPQLIPFTSLASHLVNTKIIGLLQSKVVYNQSLVNKESTEKYLEPYDKQPNAIKTFMKATSILRDRRMPKCFKEITIPVRILYGKHDHLVPKKYMTELQKIIKGSELITDKKSGHHLMEDQPNVVYEQCVDFF